MFRQTPYGVNNEMASVKHGRAPSFWGGKRACPSPPPTVFDWPCKKLDNFKNAFLIPCNP